MDGLKGKTWEDDLGEWEHVRFEPANDENGIVELTGDEIRRLWYGKLNAEEESEPFSESMTRAGGSGQAS